MKKSFQEVVVVERGCSSKVGPLTVRHALTPSGLAYRYTPDLPATAPTSTVVVNVPAAELDAAAWCARKWVDFWAMFWGITSTAALLRLSARDFSYAVLRDAERELVDLVRLADTLTVDEYNEVRGVVVTLQRVTAVDWTS
jgi:hypothetical protein